MFSDAAHGEDKEEDVPSDGEDGEDEEEES